jgi:hypothetical protein
MPRNKTRAIEDIDISIALANFWISPLIDQCKLNDIGRMIAPLFISIWIAAAYKRKPLFLYL